MYSLSVGYNFIQISSPFTFLSHILYQQCNRFHQYLKSIISLHRHLLSPNGGCPSIVRHQPEPNSKPIANATDSKNHLYQFNRTPLAMLHTSFLHFFHFGRISQQTILAVLARRRMYRNDNTVHIINMYMPGFIVARHRRKYSIQPCIGCHEVYKNIGWRSKAFSSSLPA